MGDRRPDDHPARETLPQATHAQRLALARQRLEDGYYGRPLVVDRIALAVDRLLRGDR